MVGFMQSMLASQMLKNPMLKSTAISDAGLTKQTLYEVEKSAIDQGNIRSGHGIPGGRQFGNQRANSRGLGADEVDGRLNAVFS